jgi:hypothetical protein
MDFSALKRSSQSDLDSLRDAIQKTESQGGNNNDENIWKPEVDASGNGYAIIRFLPAPAGEELPWAKLWTHGFQGPGGWYIEKSLTTLNQKDPVSDMNSRLWNSGDEDDKTIVRQRKRRLEYYSNILIVSDPKNPSNEGKVFLYRYGKKIFGKIQEAMNPEFEDETPLNPFDFWKGADFRLKIRNLDGYRNYDKSEFDTQSNLHDGDDAKLEETWKAEHSLKPFTDPNEFKTYKELEEKLHRVLGIEDANLGTASALDDEVEDYTPAKTQATTPAPTETASPEQDIPNKEAISPEEASQLDLDYFKKLAAQS